MGEDFERAMARLTAAMAGAAATPLREAYYAESHAVFETASPQRARIGDFLSAELAALRERAAGPLAMLSLGCGGGELDAALLRRPENAALGYLGVDVNAESLSLFPQDALVPQDALGRPDRALRRADALDLPEERRFDLVTAIHMIYYVADRAALIRKAQALAAPGGRTVIAVAPLSPMNRIAEPFWREQTGGGFFADDLAALLERMGVPFGRERIEAAIPLAPYLPGSENRALIDFTVQAETAALPPAAQAALTDAFRAAAVAGEDGVLRLEHPVDMFRL